MRPPRLPLFLALLTVGSASPGCYLDPSETYTASYTFRGYRPYHYHGNLVYFDTLGRPFYYRDGYKVYVPRTWSSYTHSRRYWRRNRYRYNRWHRRYHRRRYWYRPRAPLPYARRHTPRWRRGSRCRGACGRTF